MVVGGWRCLGLFLSRGLVGNVKASDNIEHKYRNLEKRRKPRFQPSLYNFGIAEGDGGMDEWIVGNVLG